MQVRLFAAVLLIELASAVGAQAGQSPAPPAGEQAMTSTVIGPENPLLTRGAEALMDGRADEGVRLTLEGIKLPTPVRDLAAAHANLCAGYVLLHRYEEALTHCNAALALDATNWRAFNNRAAVFAAQGLYDKAIEDVLAGLKLSPGATVLHQSLSIIYRDQKLHRSQDRSGSTA
jgi:tetratricopeptide (TPR) repeat protein